MKLPELFLERMKKQLGDEEFSEFSNSYNCKHTKGLRVNSLKIKDRLPFLKDEFELEQIQWCNEGFYFEERFRPSLHPYHQAGLYYLQEPSAMLPVEALDVKVGERVLDLCAAPGGKSTQITSKLGDSGLLIANEVVFSRAKILRENLQRFGTRRAIVTNNEAEELGKKFLLFFDKILVDAPCSGEGLFRKNPEATSQWSLESVLGCAKRQKQILHEAAKMLADGGRLVYSTCTFAPEENEKQIDEFLQEHPDFVRSEIENVDCFGKFSSLQIYPHIHKGEGHFVAVLQKNESSKFVSKSKREFPKSIKKNELWEGFQREFLRESLSGRLCLLNDNLYLNDFEQNLDLSDLRVLNFGLHLGGVAKNRFEPSHALALHLTANDVVNSLNFESSDLGLADYLAGESLSVHLPKGWCLVTVDGYGVGWGKVANGRLNNYLPKGLRRR